MSDPNILITTYHQAFLVRGGGEYEIFSVADNLKKSGMIVDIYGPYSRSIEHYDVILHFSVHGGGVELLNEIKLSGKPVILWPNLWILDSQEVPVALLERYVNLADVVVFKSEAEQSHFTERFKLPSTKITQVMTVADPIYLKSAPKGLFKSLYGIDNYAIWFGVIEPNKNQLAAIRVLRDKGISLVLVGRGREEGYLQECREAAGEDVLFIEALPQKSEIVRSALQEALFYIEVSHEPPGLSAIEAGLSGCRLLLSDSHWSREHFGDFATYANSAVDNSISNAVDDLLTQKHDASAQIVSLTRFCSKTAIAPLVNILRCISR